ncbi:MAG: hypothetical protein ACFFD7_11060 [Candidatus Thorarchaeota archaeon]
MSLGVKVNLLIFCRLKEDMKFNECQEDIIYYILDYYQHPREKLTPCIEVFEEIFKEKYSNLNIEENTRELVSSGVLRTLSFHEYLDFTETFKSSKDYKLFKDKKT